MDSIRDYLLSVSFAALICTLTVTLAGEKSFASKMVKLLSGVFLATVVLKAVVEFPVADRKAFESNILEKSYDAVEEGERYARDSFDAMAASSAQRIIQEEAEKLGCLLDVTVFWESDSPKEIQFRGPVSPYAKSRITQWIAENMELSGEALIWIE